MGVPHCVRGVKAKGNFDPSRPRKIPTLKNDGGGTQEKAKSDFSTAQAGSIARERGVFIGTARCVRVLLKRREIPTLQNEEKSPTLAIPARVRHPRATFYRW